jgi:hypothetical protein
MRKIAGMIGVGLVMVACMDANVPTQSGQRVVPRGPALIHSPVTGAVFTSTNPSDDLDPSNDHNLCINAKDSDAPAIDCNIYLSKNFVWLSGGPGPSGLPDGVYLFAVLDPGGQQDPNDGAAANLSDATPGGGDDYTNRIFTVTGGLVGYSGTHAFASIQGGMIGLMPYDNTTNPGGEYVMAVCQLSNDPTSTAYDLPVAPSDCKYDNFKVRDGGNLNQYGTFSVDKFYDANGNGAQDAGEPPIAGWPMTLNELLPTPGATQNTPATWLLLDPGNYSVTEAIAAGTSWYISYKGGASGLKADNLLAAPVLLSGSSAAMRTISGITIVANEGESRLFGNYCVVGSGGLTLGFWSNNNGQAILAQHDIAWRTLLNGPDLVSASPKKTGGFTVTPFNVDVVKAFATYNSKKQLTGGAFYDFMQWILAAQSSINGEARYMLSAQLAAMMLNVAYGGVDGNALDPNSGKTINQLIADAQNALSDLTVSRENVVAIKTYLDLLNKGGNVIPTSPTSCGTPTF